MLTPLAALDTAAQPRLLLGSTSPYRRALLERLRVPFECVSPQVDEAPLPQESPLGTARRLALAKANEVAARHADAIVIGSDQVADLDGMALGKPGTPERALAQLQAMRGRTVLFHTAVAVARPATRYVGEALCTIRVQFGSHSDAVLQHYLSLDQPYDCAGSAKCETLGIALLDSVESDDPTALTGLPLIRTCALLRAAGLEVMAWAR